MELLITIPTTGSVKTGFFTTMIALTQHLRSRGITFAIKTYQFSDIVMSRNYLMSYFLSHDRFTHCLLLDSDLSFRPIQFDRLAELDVDFAAGVYPKKNYHFDRLRELMSNPDNAGIETRNLVNMSLDIVRTARNSRSEEFKSKVNGDFETVPAVGTGFMLIKRAVPETIANKSQARHIPRSGRFPIYRDAPKFYDFFSHLYTDEDDAIFGEDQSFCRRWVLGCGGDIWLDTKSKIGHIGDHQFGG